MFSSAITVKFEKKQSFINFIHPLYDLKSLYYPIKSLNLTLLVKLDNPKLSNLSVQCACKTNALSFIIFVALL